MKLRVVNTATGFVPETDTDYEAKKKLKRGAVYEITIKECRNPKFHRLYFSLISIGWEFLNEQQQAFFRNDIETFRKTVEIAAGHYEPVYSISRRTWLEIPKSIAFDKLSESDFHDLYENVKRVISQVFVPEDGREAFEYEIKNF